MSNHFHKEWNQPSLKVFGTGMLQVRPDVAELESGVVTEAADALTAQEENAIIMNRLYQALLSIPITQENIQTIEYSIYPQYDYQDGNPVLKGYQVTNRLSIRVTDLAQTGLIIDTAVQNGANHISNIVFTLSDDHRYYRQALQLAIQNAYQKAQTMTQTIRVQLFPVPFHITELMPSRPQPFQAYSLKASNATTPIEPGQIEIEANIEMKFTYYC